MKDFEEFLFTLYVPVYSFSVMSGWIFLGENQYLADLMVECILFISSLIKVESIAECSLNAVSDQVLHHLIMEQTIKIEKKNEKKPPKSQFVQLIHCKIRKFNSA